MRSPWVTRPGLPAARGASLLLSAAMLAGPAAPTLAQDAGSPSAPGLASLGAERESFAEDFDVPGAWGTVDDEVTRIAHEDGALVFTHRQAGSARVTSRRPAQASPAMRLEVDVEIGADGTSAGPMCGTTAGRSDHVLGVIDTSDSWVVGRMLDGAISLLARGAIEGTDVSIGRPVRVAVECATTEGGSRVAMWVAGRLVADLSVDEPRGPFDWVGVYSDSATAGSIVRVDDAVAFDAGPVPGLETLGADTQVLAEDTFAPDAWAANDDPAVGLAFDGGSLAVSFPAGGGGRLLTRWAPQASRQLRTELDVAIGPGSRTAGPLCVTADPSPGVAFGVVDADDWWSVGRILEGEPRIIARGRLDGLDVSPDTPVRVALECAVTHEGDRMALWVAGRLVADVTSTQQHGPYDRVGVYADAADDGSVRFDRAVVRMGDPVETLTSLGAETLVVEDGFRDRSLWTTGKARQGSVSYDKGRLRIALRLPGSSLWSWRVLTDAVPVIRIEGTIRLGDGQGDAGFLCGAAGEDPPAWFAGLGDRGEVVVGSASSALVTELLRVPLPDGVAPAASYRVAVECAVTGSGDDRVVVWVDGVLALDHRPGGSPGVLARAALYARAASRRFAADFDDIRILAGTAYAPIGDRPPAPADES